MITGKSLSILLSRDGTHRSKTSWSHFFFFFNPAKEDGQKESYDSGRGGVILDGLSQREESEVRREALPISRGYSEGFNGCALRIPQKHRIIKSQHRNLQGQRVPLPDNKC